MSEPSTSVPFVIESFESAYRPARLRAKAATFFLSALLGVTVFSLLSVVAITGAVAIDAELGSAVVGALVPLLAKLAAIEPWLMTLAFLSFCSWFYRVYKNVWTLGEETERDPYWAILGFFFPAYQFVVPYQIARELIDVYDRRIVRSWLPLVAWISLVSGLVLLQLMPMLGSSVAYFVIAAALAATGYVAVIRFVRKIQAWQTEQEARIID